MAEEMKNQDDMNNEMTFEERQYQRLINARNFHYENFNKWSLYFYAIIAALFVGYYHIEGNIILSCVIALVGYIVSICCYLSGKGYYYWEINWIRMLHNYEREVLKETKDKEELRIYSRFYDIKKSSFPMTLWKGANISSSKLSLWMSFIIACSWGFLLMKSLVQKISVLKVSQSTTMLIIAIIGTWCITYILALLPCIKSDMQALDEAKSNKTNNK